MGTPYEEISENYTNRGAVKTDANLAQDTLQLGGIDAEEFATKKYVRDYVNNKAENINNRTDELIEQAKEDLKGYTDIAISNQDFTNFARKSDVAAAVNNMKDHCAESCANSLNAAKQYTDNAINNVNTSINNIRNNITNINNNISNMQSDINSINSDVSNINESISELDGKYDELFQSVSNGKSKIAEAITDKGVYTSAIDTFQNMANNIEQIQTGSDIDTSDATITPDTVRNGYIGYGRNGVRVVGTYIPDESGGGNSEISNGENVGNSNAVDTSDATATSDKILAGYTAYARGEKIFGSFIPQGTDSIISENAVEKIYGISRDIPNKNTIGHYNAIETNFFAISHDRKYVIKAYNSDGVKKIGVFEIYYNDIIDQYQEVLATTYTGLNGETFTVKREYTYSELGITDVEIVRDIKLSNVPTRFGNGNATYQLFILTRRNRETRTGFIHIYSFNRAKRTSGTYTLLGETVNRLVGGEIGIENSEDYPMEMSGAYSRYLDLWGCYNSDLEPFANAEIGQMAVPELNADMFAINMKRGIATLKLTSKDTVEVVNFFITNTFADTWTWDIVNIYMRYEGGDKFLKVVNSLTGVSNNLKGGRIYQLDSNGYILRELSYPESSYAGYYRPVAVSPNGSYCAIGDILYSIDSAGTLSKVSNNSINNGLSNNAIMWFSNDGNFIYCVQYANGLSILYMYEVDYTGTKTTANLIGSVEFPCVYPIILYNGIDFFGLYNSNTLYWYSHSIDNSNVIGLKYNGQYFYNINNLNLTATPSDVLTGRTFIGYSGKQQIGILNSGASQSGNSEENESRNWRRRSAEVGRNGRKMRVFKNGGAKK